MKNRIEYVREVRRMRLMVMLIVLGVMLPHYALAASATDVSLRSTTLCIDDPAWMTGSISLGIASTVLAIIGIGARLCKVSVVMFMTVGVSVVLAFGLLDIIQLDGGPSAAGNLSPDAETCVVHYLGFGD